MKEPSVAVVRRSSRAPPPPSQIIDVSAPQMVASESPLKMYCAEFRIHEKDVIFRVRHDTPRLRLCVREGFGPCVRRIRILHCREPHCCEAGSREFCRDFIDVVEGILSNNGTMLHAGDRAIVIAISQEQVKLKFWDNIPDVSREW